MSAALLREAADRLDALADAATPGPWKMWNGWGPTADGLMGFERMGPDSGERVFHHDQQQDLYATRSDAEYVATMSPTVGKALAMLLRTEAQWADISGHVVESVAVARAVLGRDA